MKNTELKNRKPTSKSVYIILFIIIALQLFRIIYSFAFLKEGYHSDESWSFGLANSYFEPYIFQNADETSSINENQWLSGSVFKDYLTVNNEQRFSYDSVFYNQTKDLHPPLYYMILHTICSFFPGRFSYWYGFVINIAAFIIAQFFLFGLIKETTHSSIAAIAGIILYGTSIGALNTYVFVRMYALMTMFSVITAYLHVKMYNDKNLKKHLPPIFIITVLGCLTNHFFLLYAGTLSACFCIYYLFKKDYKTLAVYSIVLLAAAIASVIIFPATIHHLFGRRGEIYKYTMDWQIRYCFNFALSELFSLHISIFGSPILILISIVILCSLVIIAPLFFLLRKETWFIKFKNSIKTKFKTFLNKLKEKLQFFNFPVLFMFITAISGIIGTSLTVSVMEMMESTDRYMFNVYPAICVVAVSLIYYFLKWTISNKKSQKAVILTLTTLVTLLCNIRESCIYLFPKFEENMSNSEFTQMIKNEDCIFVTETLWLLTCFSENFSECSNVYVTLKDNIIENTDTIIEGTDKTPIYMIVDTGVFNSSDNRRANLLKNRLGTGNDEGNVITDTEDHEELFTEEILLDTLNSSSLIKDIKPAGSISVFMREYYVYSVELN